MEYREFSDAGEKVLQKVKSLVPPNVDEVIYGLYNNSGKGFLVRLNDFFIDHSKVSLKEKSYFFHMLAVMVDAGIPVVKALKSLSVRSENRRFVRVLNTIAYNCESGENLAESMLRFEDVFDVAEIGIVRSGEATGRLDKMLFQLSDNLDKRNDLNTKLWGAAIYPISVLVVLALVMVAMLTWVFPSLLNLLKEGGVTSASLPIYTRFLLGFQGIVVNYWYLIIFGFLLIYAGFAAYVGTDFGRVRVDYLKLKLPIVGSLIRKVYVLRFVGMLGLLIDAGIPVLKTLEIAGRALSNRIYALKVAEVMENVRQGEKISENLKDTRFLFPSEVVQMLAVGEASASLGRVSEKVSQQYQKEVENSLKKLSSIFEPLMVLIVGVLVALLALAIMSPIFNLTSLVA